MPEQTALRIAVVGGGANDEHDVSLASAAAVARAASALGLDVVALSIAWDGTWCRTDGARLTAADAVALLTSCDVAWPVLHGVDGEDGAAAGLLRLTGVPFVGSPVRAGALAMDKWVTKVVAEALGIRTAPGVLVGPGRTAEDVDLALPVVVKPVSGGSSNGVSVVADRTELAAALDLARSAGEGVLVERFVRGREVDVALFRDRDGGLRAGSTLEIGVDAGDVFGREQKYDGSAVFTVPARLSDDEHAELLAAARALYDAIGCAGLARFDFFVTPAGPVLNEVNTTPGFTERSQVPRMYAAVGLDYADLVRAVIEAALQRPV
jgi:D-alanine-D-alanine ligase